jgi:hypothetical protein
MLDSTQVAKAFFADASDEKYVSIGFDASEFHRSEYGQDDNKATRIVTDSRRVERVSLGSHRNVSFHWKHGVQVGGVSDDAVTRFSGPAPDYITHAVNSDIRQAGIAQHLGEMQSAILLSEWRCWNLGEFNKVLS